MKPYYDIQTVSLSKDRVRKAWDFAHKVVVTTNYQDSNQGSIDKIRLDHFASKLGEEAAMLVLNKYAPVVGPDYSIYTGKNKSWEADLFVNKLPIAVKSQTRSAAQKYGLSWTFQCGSRRTDPILKDPNAWVVFTECNDLKPYQVDVYPMYQVKELLFEEPKLDYLKAHKKVVYAKNLKL